MSPLSKNKNKYPQQEQEHANMEENEESDDEPQQVQREEEYHPPHINDPYVEDVDDGNEVEPSETLTSICLEWPVTWTLTKFSPAYRKVESLINNWKTFVLTSRLCLVLSHSRSKKHWWIVIGLLPCKKS